MYNIYLLQRCSRLDKNSSYRATTVFTSDQYHNFNKKYNTTHKPALNCKFTHVENAMDVNVQQQYIFFA